MKMHCKYIWFQLLIMSITLISCSNAFEDFETSPEESCNNFICTRAGDDDQVLTTYRVLTYRNSYMDQWYKNFGTYSGIPGQVMKPTILYDDGTIDTTRSPEEHKTAGFDGISGSQALITISPGIKNNDDGTFSFCPVDPDNGKLLISNMMNVYIGLFGTHDLGKLYDRRATFTFNFTIDPQVTDKIKSINISDLKVFGVGGGPDENGDYEVIKYQPALRQIIASNNPRIITLDVTAESNGLPTTWSNKDNPCFIASAFYAPMDIIKTLLSQSALAYDSDYLQLSFALSQNGGKEVIQSFILNEHIPEFEAQHHYEFNFTVRSFYIDLTLTDVSYEDESPNGWYVLPSMNETIGDLPSKRTIHLGSWQINGWETNDVDLSDNLPIGSNN